jgi:hypothetical protein
MSASPSRSPRRPTRALLLALGLTSACSSAGLDGSEQAGAQAHADDDAPSTNVAEGAFVRSRPLAEVSALWASATVEAPPDGKTVISAPLAGRVVRVRVREGDRIEAGAPVVEVTLPALARTAAEHERASARLLTLRPRLEQLRALSRSGVARAADLADAEVNVTDAEGDRQLTEALLRAAGYGPGDAPTLMQRGGRVTLRAPREGLVVHVPPEVAPGAPFGDQGELAVLAHEVAPRVRAHLAPELLDVAWPGFVLVTPAAEVPLKLVSAAPALDARDGTRETWLDRAGEQALPLGARGWVRPAPDVLTWVVPRDALSMSDQASDPVVMARQGGALVPIAVKLLATSGGLALITGPTAPLTVQVRERSAPTALEAAP